MAATTLVEASKVQQWDSKLFVEYSRISPFRKMMGTDENSIIQVKEQLEKKAGDKINVPLFTKLTGSGVTGDNTLEGNEEAMSNFSDQVEVDQRRHAVLVTNMEEQRTEIDLRDAGKVLLKIWLAEQDRTDVLNALASMSMGGVTAYADLTEAQKDEFAAANSDRILAGALVSNYNADHSTMLATIDDTNDDMSPGIGSLAKRRMKLASPAIRPVMLKNGKEQYVALLGSITFRDMKNNLSTIHQNAGERGTDNQIFQDGDLIHDGTVYKEIPEIDDIADVGDGGTTDVGHVHYLGAQALCMAYAKRPFTKTKDFDYDNQYGVAIGQIRGVKKLMYGASSTTKKQHGVLTCWVSATPDA
jgi:N4-gp56 family major capsid protein